MGPLDGVCSGFQCTDGGCVPLAGRCNQVGDCGDASDERGCTCADFLRAQSLQRKICDGVVDCWDYSDEKFCGISTYLFIMHLHCQSNSNEIYYYKYSNLIIKIKIKNILGLALLTDNVVI